MIFQHICHRALHTISNYYSLILRHDNINVNWHMCIRNNDRFVFLAKFWECKTVTRIVSQGICILLKIFRTCIHIQIDINIFFFMLCQSRVFILWYESMRAMKIKTNKKHISMWHQCNDCSIYLHIDIYSDCKTETKKNNCV